ncbi:hypothetical protein H671_4g13019 [Cricetulus griseus]|uniref:Uncharacterized protein n=1 Tax=Cricetulus griseus TaxID=10029 RepID=A0A061I1J8_CRIGR|nr:hypothetical protein H671_4g13019 [Cricetulus griseus]
MHISRSFYVNNPQLYSLDISGNEIIQQPKQKTLSKKKLCRAYNGLDYSHLHGSILPDRFPFSVCIDTTTLRL